MSGLFKRKINFQVIRKLTVKIGLIDRFKQLGVRKKVGAVVSVGTLLVVEIGEAVGSISGLIAGYTNLKVVVKGIEEGEGNKYTNFVRENIKEIDRRKMIGNGVGQGLAWFHYATYLQHVLPDIEMEIKQSNWYAGLSTEEEGRISMKLYELIPRKCYVNIPGTDNNIMHETDITIKTTKNIKVPIYSIKDGETKYYCICNCPGVLKTMNNVNDIQMAGIFRSKNTNFNFPWMGNSKVQLFNVDTKLVQLMRFYYTLSSLLCLSGKDKDRARLLLINDSKKPSKVLLRAIKEDLKINTPKKKRSLFMKGHVWRAEELEDGSYDVEMFLSYPNELLGHKREELKKESDQHHVTSQVADSLKQITHSSLLEKKLLSAEECKDVFYDFDVFVTRRKEFHDKNLKENNTDGNNMQNQLKKREIKVNNTDVKNIQEKLKKKNMKVLFEEECIGEDWLTKLKYAATKCRWVVFLDTDNSSSKLFTSHKVTDSLKEILASRNVQTVAIVNKNHDRHILDDLRWVTCIPHNGNVDHVIDTLYKVMSGSEIKLKKSTDLYLKPGEVAVGLAWYYAANRLNKILPVIYDKVAKDLDGKKLTSNKPKLFLVVPQSSVAHDSLLDAQFPQDQNTKTPRDKMPRDLLTYTVVDGDKEPKYCVAEYPRSVDVICKMKEEHLLNEQQTKLELEQFYKTVDKIMELLLPEKTDDYEFVYYNDTKEQIGKILVRIYQEEEFRLAHEQFHFQMCNIISSL